MAGGHAPRPSPSETLVITGLLPIVDGGPLGGRRCQAVATAAVGEGDETALNPADGSPMVEVARLMAGERENRLLRATRCRLTGRSDGRKRCRGAVERSS